MGKCDRVVQDGWIMGLRRGDNMKPKRGETAEQTINRWADELLITQGSYDHALEMVEWLKAELLRRKEQY